MTWPRNRAYVMERIAELAEYALTDLDLYEDRTVTFEIQYGWDEQPVFAPSFFIGTTEGPSTSTSIGPNPNRDDEWTLSCQIAVPGCPDNLTAMKAAEVALNAFDDVLKASPRLANSSVASANEPDPGERAVWAVSSALIADVNGPYRAPSGDPAKVPGIVDFTISFTTQLK